MSHRCRSLQILYNASPICLISNKSRGKKYFVPICQCRLPKTNVWLIRWHFQEVHDTKSPPSHRCPQVRRPVVSIHSLGSFRVLTTKCFREVSGTAEDTTTTKRPSAFRIGDDYIITTSTDLVSPQLLPIQIPANGTDALHTGQFFYPPQFVLIFFSPRHRTNLSLPSLPEYIDVVDNPPSEHILSWRI